MNPSTKKLVAGRVAVSRSNADIQSDSGALQSRIAELTREVEFWKEMLLKNGGQRACLALELFADVKPEKHSKTRDVIARDLGISGRYVQDAIMLRDDAKELFEQVKDGSISLKKAVSIAKEKWAGMARAKRGGMR